jgi:glucokinase
LEFNADGYIVLGVDMGGTEKLYGAISEIGGHIINEVDIDRRGASGEDCYKLLTDLIDTLLASPGLKGRKVRGIGVGAPGITHHRAGIVKWAYALNWKDFPLKQRLAKRYKFPITVDNDVNLAALGEYWYGAGQNIQNMIMIVDGAGIGAGIILDGTLYRGSTEASGEIGHLIPGREFLGKSYLDFGGLESVASGTAIINLARAALESRKEPPNLDRLRAADVFESARNGEKWASVIVRDVVDYLAIAVANLAVSFDPELIVLGGGMASFAHMLVEPILSRLAGTLPTQPKLVVSNLGLRATVMGAITTVLHNTSNFYMVQKLS